MKQVLVVDQSPIFGEYLSAKLGKAGLRTEIAVSGTEGYAKIKSSPPDVLVVNYQLGNQNCTGLLRVKNADPEMAKIPVVVLAHEVDQKQIIELSIFNVKKIFSKPLKIDAFFKTLGNILGIPFSLDETPGNFEVAVNDGVMFIEISQGFNRDKMELLPYKLRELAALYQIGLPKLVVTLKDLDVTRLSEDYRQTLKTLQASLLATAKNQPENVCLLASDPVIGAYIQDHKDYAEMVFAKELKDVMETFVGASRKPAPAVAGVETLQLRFEKDDSLAAAVAVAAGPFDEMKDVLKGRRAAIVDDDFIVRDFVKKIYSNSGATLLTYNDGQEFVDALENAPKDEAFDLVFLDIVMPRLDGFEVLRDLKLRNFTRPVVVLSSVAERDSIVRAFKMGVKSYLTKPLKPDLLFKKTMEILKGAF